MKIALKLLGFVLFCFCLQVNTLTAQTPDEIIFDDPEEEETKATDKPIDDIVEKRMTIERRLLPYENIREADVMWQKKVWRVLDTREKMNLPFTYPERPFFTILMEAAMSEEITVYSTEDDKFTNPLTPDEVASMGASVDTVITFDPETYEEQIQIVQNDINPEDVKRFRFKEIWFFDEESSTMKVRVIGIAPLIDVKDEETGEFRYEQPMFWVYYPDARKILAKERVYNSWNSNGPMTWEDLFEMRFFSSYIYKEDNVFDRKIQDYMSGLDILLEADKIKSEIFNFEHDLWSY